MSATSYFGTVSDKPHGPHRTPAPQTVPDKFVLCALGQFLPGTANPTRPGPRSPNMGVRADSSPAPVRACSMFR